MSQLLTNTEDFDCCDEIKLNFVAFNPCMLYLRQFSILYASVLQCYCRLSLPAKQTINISDSFGTGLILPEVVKVLLVNMVQLALLGLLYIYTIIRYCCRLSYGEWLFKAIRQLTIKMIITITSVPHQGIIMLFTMILFLFIFIVIAVVRLPYSQLERLLNYLNVIFFFYSFQGRGIFGYVQTAGKCGPNQNCFVHMGLICDI